MTIIPFDFAGSRRRQEEYLIALADAVRETVNESPIESGPLSADDLLDCEIEAQSADAETEFVTYRYAVGAVVGQPGEVIDVDAYRDPDAHAKALIWAQQFLAKINYSFELRLGVRS